MINLTKSSFSWKDTAEGYCKSKGIIAWLFKYRIFHFVGYFQDISLMMKVFVQLIIFD